MNSDLFQLVRILFSLCRAVVSLAFGKIVVYLIVMADIECIIAAVENYPCIWDLNHIDYKDRTKKELAWDEICETVFDKMWKTFSKKEKHTKRLDIKRKWSNCRDYYKKDVLKSLPTSSGGSGQKRARRYVYADILKFLDKVLIENISSSDDVFYFAMDRDDPHDDPEISSIVKQEEPQIQKTAKDLEQPTSKSDTSTTTDANQKNLPTVYIADDSTNLRKETEGDDTKFLLSFLGDMSSMNRNQRLDFKLGMVQLLKNIFQSPATTTEANFGSITNHVVSRHSNF